MSTPSARAFECAIALLDDFPDRLTQAQRVQCHVAALAGPDEAPLDAIALACHLVGART